MRLKRERLIVVSQKKSQDVTFKSEQLERGLKKNTTQSAKIKEEPLRTVSTGAQVVHAGAALSLFSAGSPPVVMLPGVKTNCPSQEEPDVGI